MQHNRSIPSRRPQDSRNITDGRLLAEVRRLIAAELAGFLRGDNGRRNVCLEPGCTCGLGICGPFREKPQRCRAFETLVLPRHPAVEAAYWAHLRGEGGRFTRRRCVHSGCRKIAAEGSAYCPWHTEVHARLARHSGREMPPRGVSGSLDTHGSERHQQPVPVPGCLPGGVARENARLGADRGDPAGRLAAVAGD